MRLSLAYYHPAASSMLYQWASRFQNRFTNFFSIVLLSSHETCNLMDKLDIQIQDISGVRWNLNQQLGAAYHFPRVYDAFLKVWCAGAVALQLRRAPVRTYRILVRTLSQHPSRFQRCELLNKCFNSIPIEKSYVYHGVQQAAQSAVFLFLHQRKLPAILRAPVSLQYSGWIINTRRSRGFRELVSWPPPLSHTRKHLNLNIS